MALSNVCPSRMAPPCKNPMKTHMQRRSWVTDRQPTLPRPCDLGHGHGKTSQSGPSTRHNCPSNDAEAETEPRNHESAPENVMATQTTVLSRMSVNTSTLQRTWHDGRYLLFSNTSWALPKMLTKKHMSVGAKHFVKTHGVPTPANTICRRRVR